MFVKTGLIYVVKGSYGTKRMIVTSEFVITEFVITEFHCTFMCHLRKYL